MLLRTVSTPGNKSIKDEESFHAAKYVPRLLQDFVLGDSLGRGGFGEIIKATHKYDGNQVAIKIIKYEVDADSLKKTCREANTLARLSHPNIVRYFNSWAETAKVPVAEYKKFNLSSASGESISSEIKKLNQDGYLNKSVEFDEDDDEEQEEEEEEEENDADGDDDSISFRSEKEEIKELNYLFIQMELCDKRTLRNAIDDDLHLEEPKSTKYFRQICEGLSYIHQNNIIHRDLKPENIFLACGDVIKIGDFGLSKQITLKNEFGAFEGGENLSDLACASLTAPCGTSIYIAPEFFFRAYCNVKADIYSLGVIYFEMCSQPMTQMEKVKLFPLTCDCLNTMHFLTNKKKSLLKSLLHPVDRARPSCEQILEIIKSEKTIEEVRAMIQRSQKVPPEQFKIFNKALKSNKIRRLDMTHFFMTTAVKVFEVHGGRTIPMPTFLPSFNNFPDNLTTLLNTSGNSMSIANTSRVAFSYHVARHKIKKIRRYSTAKVFKEGNFWPSEFQECVFQAVSPEHDDYVLDAEMLFIGSEICGKIFADDVAHPIRFVVNHHLIFESILKHCRISDDLTTLFTNNFLLNSPVKLSFAIKALCRFHLNREVEGFMLKMFSGFKIQEAEEEIRSRMSANRGNTSFAIVNRKWLNTAFKQISGVVANAQKFGIRRENIFLHPLFVNERHSEDIMFKITYGYEYNTILATGGRFNSVIKRCGNRGKELSCSACEISFNVSNVVKLLNPDKCARVVDVVIVADDKSMAVPLFKDLLSQNIKCEIVKELVLSNRSNEQPLIVIQLDDEDYGIVYRLEKSGRMACTLTEVFRGNLQTVNINNYLKPRNLPRQRQITWLLSSKQLD